MTDDPKRWRDDDAAPPELRAYLRGASTSEATMPSELRARMRPALLKARELDSDAGPATGDRDEQVVAIPTERGRTTPGPAAVFAMLAAAIILLGVVLYGPEPHVTPPTPAVGPEPIDAGTDASVLERIEVEKVCGDREDSDWQCDLVVRPSHSYERIELHAANGIRPPTCDGASEQHREPAEGDQRFVLSDGGSERGLRAFTVCGYQGGVLTGMGSIEGHRNFPWAALGRRRGGDDVRIALDAIDDDITHLELRWIPRSSDDDHRVGPGCPGERVLSVRRDELAPLVGRERLALFRHVLTPEERAPSFVLCAFSDAGVSHRRTGYRFPEDDQPFVLTASGELPMGEIRSAVAALGPDGLVTVSRLDSGAGGAANRRRVDRMRARMEAASATPARELVLANGQILILPRGARLGPRTLGAEPSIATLRDGTTTTIVSARPLAPATSEDGDHLRIARDAVLTSFGEGCVFLDDVVVALFATGDVAPRATEIETAVPEPVRVVPQVAYECQVDVLLELDEVPSGMESVAIAFVRHRGEVDLATRPTLDCESASIAMELPAAAIAALPTDPGGMRQLALAFSDAPDDFDDLRDDGSYCMAPYAVIACVRDASGLHALPGASGRWTHSGMACFASDTPVATDDGAVSIASLRPGDRVLAFDPNRGETTLTTVTRLVPRGERAILTFILSNGAALRVTPEHPLFDSADRRFRRAETFVAGDRLRGIDGSDVAVIERGDSGDRTQVFDLSVAGPHTYFAAGIVAHNY